MLALLHRGHHGGELVDRLARHPMMRALRCDKLVLAALEATLLAYAEKYMHPTWNDGAYFFPAHDHRKGENGLPVTLTPLAGNVLLPLARINVPDGVFATFHEPFGKRHFEEPYIDGIDHPSVLVRQAVYDREHRVLLICLEPTIAPQKIRFREKFQREFDRSQAQAFTCT